MIVKYKSAYIILIFSLAIFACQKGIHWEFDSEGSLLKDSTGNCMPVAVTGTFTTNKQTGDTNFLTVSVDVTAAGNYLITTDSMNGFIFKASGVFNNVGVATVKLISNGVPRMPGTTHFNIQYNNSVCEADVVVLSDTIPAASYTLQGSPNTCMNDTIQGSYLQTAPLDTSNKIIISVNVITPGKYAVSTNTVNGYSFSSEGVFTTAGVQSIIIKGDGTPLNPGTDNFTVNADNNFCSFSINVSSVIQVTNPLHFPLTAGSYWTYVDAFNDTTKRYVNGDTVVLDTAHFIRVSEVKKYSSQNYFFKYDGADYNEFGKADKYTTSFQYGSPNYGLLPFLKEYVSTGASWESATFSGAASFGQTIYVKYSYYCLSNIASKLVSGFGFKDVIVIAVYPQIKSDFGTWGSTTEVYYCYYAKGVGLIYEEESTNGYPPHPVLQIIDWKVN